jgi:hypothetical protein
MAEEKKKPRGLAQALGFKDGRDMFDGGGRHAVGDTFKGGGPLSALANAMNIAPAGYHARQANAPAPTRAAQMQQRGYRKPTRGTKDYSFLKDIRDGGGIGYEGNKFRGGGAYSVLANMLGLRPEGYDERMDEAQALAGGTQTSAARPSRIAGGTGISAPQRDLSGTDFEPAPYQFEPVVTPPVYGVPIGAMPMEELIRIANQGIHNSTRDRLGNGTFIYK